MHAESTMLSATFNDYQTLRIENPRLPFKGAASMRASMLTLHGFDLTGVTICADFPVIETSMRPRRVAMRSATNFSCVHGFVAGHVQRFSPLTWRTMYQPFSTVELRTRSKASPALSCTTAPFSPRMSMSLLAVQGSTVVSGAM